MSQELAVIEISELLILLLIAVGVALATKYVNLPYTSALVLVGLLVGTSGLVPDIDLSRELIFFVFLPPLLFEGALRMDLENIRENLKPILILAVPGVIVSTALVGYTLNYILGMDLALALLFGAMITPTDPVSVLATFKRLGVPLRLANLVEGESVFNDGTGVVVFGIVLGMMETGNLNLFKGSMDFTFVVLGGSLIGLVVGYAAYTVLAQIDDHLIEVTVTLVLAFSVFIIAERLHTSGVIGVVVAGLIVGNYGRILAMSPTTRVALTTFWDLAVFVINSLVFLLIGKEIRVDILASRVDAITVAIIAVLFARALTVYPLCTLFNRASKVKIPFSWQHTAFWGGLHGTIPVALALGLAKDMPGRDLLLAMTFGVVLFSLVVQGLSFEWIVPRFGLKKVSGRRLMYEQKLGESIAVNAAINELEKMDRAREVSKTVLDELLSQYTGERDALAEEISRIVGNYGEISAGERFVARKRALLAQKSALIEALRRGIISEEVVVALAEEIDTTLDALGAE